MSPYWKIVDLNIMMYCGTEKLGEFLFEHVDWLEDLLRTEIKFPKAADLGPSKLVNRPAPEGVTSSPKRLHDLPAEVICIIFDQMTLYDFRDAVMFAHADAFLLQCGESHLRKLYKQCFAPFAGHRLICISKYARDLPSSLCNSKELCRITCATMLCNNDPIFPDDNDDDYYYNSNARRSPITLPTEEMFNPQDATLVDKIARALFRAPWPLKGHVRLLTGLDQDQPLQVLGPDCAAMHWLRRPPKNSGGIVILRNLSKRIFVRSDTLSEIMGVTATHDDIGRVVVAHISWSSGPAVYGYDGQNRCGEWAGDEFDVIPADSFNLYDTESTDGPAWKDVTVSVASAMTDTWKSEFGDDWKEWRMK